MTGRVGPRAMVRPDGRLRSGGERVGRPTADHVVDAMSLVAMALTGGCAPIDAIEIVAEVSPPWVAHQLRTVTAGLHWGLDPDQCWAQVSPAWSGWPGDRPGHGGGRPGGRSGARGGRGAQREDRR